MTWADVIVHHEPNQRHTRHAGWNVVHKLSLKLSFAANAADWGGTVRDCVYTCIIRRQLRFGWQWRPRDSRYVLTCQSNLPVRRLL